MEENFKLKSIIFDLGGVVFENGTQMTIQFLNKEFDVDNKVLSDIFYGNLSWELRKGKITYRDFWDTIYRRFPNFFKKVNNNAEMYWHDSYTIRPFILNMLQNLKGIYCLGAISGNIKERIDFLENKYSFSNLFDFTIYSFDLKEDKLSDKLYEQAIFELSTRELLPRESLYIDDNLDCLDVASKLGFNIYLFNDIDNFKTDSYKYGLQLT